MNGHTGSMAARVYLAIGASALALSAWPALAQENPDDGTASGTGEIIVTAQFREQRLQDTPLAITAVTADMLEA